MRVLVVDDNKIDLNGVCETVPWDKLGCTLVGAERNGKTGYDAAIALKPDLIITDISMPFMDGITMCQKIREILPEVNIIFLSCLEEFDLAKKAVSLGRCEYLTKPIDLNCIMETIMKIKNCHEKEIKKELKLFNLEKELKSLRPYLRTNFFRDVLLDIVPNKSFNKRQIRELDIDVSCNYCLILCEIDNSSEKYSLEKTFLSDTVSLVMNEIESDKIIDIYCGVVAILLTGEIKKDKIIEQLNEVQRRFNEFTDATLTICIGDTQINFEELHNEYERLNLLLKDNIFSMSNDIFFANEIRERSENDDENINFSELQNDISTALNSEYDDAVTAMIEKYIKSGSEADIKSIACYIICNLNIVLFKMNVLSGEISIENFLTKIINCSGISEIRDCLEEILRKCRDKLAINMDTADYVVKNVKTIVNENYSTIQTVEDITDRMHINFLYANRLFKKYTGNTIYKYLLQVRMEKAMELIKNSTCNIGQIGEMVGFNTSRYFSTVFKNHTGMSPKEYRIKSMEEK